MSQGGKTQLTSRKEIIPQVGKKASRVGLAGQFLSARAPMCVIVDRGVLQGTPKCVAFTMAPSVASQYVCNARENDSAQVVDGKWRVVPARQCEKMTAHSAQHVYQVTPVDSAPVTTCVTSAYTHCPRGYDVRV